MPPYNRALQAAFALCLLTQLAMIGAFVYWYGGFFFGMRFFINLTPFFAIGLAALASRLRPALVWADLGLMTAWSLLFILSLTYILKEDVVPGYAVFYPGRSTPCRTCLTWCRVTWLAAFSAA